MTASFRFMVPYAMCPCLEIVLAPTRTGWIIAPGLPAPITWLSVVVKGLFPAFVLRLVSAEVCCSRAGSKLNLDRFEISTRAASPYDLQRGELESGASALGGFKIFFLPPPGGGGRRGGGPKGGNNGHAADLMVTVFTVGRGMERAQLLLPPGERDGLLWRSIPPTVVAADVSR